MRDRSTAVISELARLVAAGQLGYDCVAEALFGGLEVGGFFLEYDDARSGGFTPLRFVPPGKTRRSMSWRSGAAVGATWSGPSSYRRGAPR